PLQNGGPRAAHPRPPPESPRHRSGAGAASERGIPRGATPPTTRSSAGSQRRGRRFRKRDPARRNPAHHAKLRRIAAARAPLQKEGSRAAQPRPPREAPPDRSGAGAASERGIPRGATPPTTRSSAGSQRRGRRFRKRDPARRSPAHHAKLRRIAAARAPLQKDVDGARIENGCSVAHRTTPVRADPPRSREGIPPSQPRGSEGF